MAALQIPIDTTEDQQVRVLVDETRYTFRFIWNELLEFWSMDISTDTTTLMQGKNLAGGAELINQYNLPFSNIYVVNLVDNAAEMVLANTGTTSLLVILSDEDIELIEEEVTA